MPCYHPQNAVRYTDDTVSFLGKSCMPKRAYVEMLQLPCGQCIGCREKSSQSWALRGVHELSMHEQSCFYYVDF